MKKLWPFIILIIPIAFFAWRVQTSHRFQSSDFNNVFNLRGQINGATASLVNLPDGQQVLTTQVHVLESFAKYPLLKLTWRKFYGWNFQEWLSHPGAFEINFVPKVLWQDDDLDVAFLEVPAGLLEACKCTGLQTRNYHEGPAFMVGYPQTGMRTYPLVGQPWKKWGTLLGTVEQEKSTGKTWIMGEEFVADIDGLPGNSGSSIMDSDGKVIGMLHLLKSWYGEGYEYKVPSVNLSPIEQILQQYEEDKANPLPADDVNPENSDATSDTD